MPLQLVLLCVSTALSACAVWFAWRALQRSEPRVLRELRRNVDLLELDTNELFDRMQRQSAKLAGRAKRDASSSSSSDTAQRAGESTAAWKQRMRGLIQNGQLHHN